VSSAYQTGRQIIGLPEVDAAIGVLPGLPVGLATVGGLDLLVSASYLPDVSEGNVRVNVTREPLKIGYGVRVGLLRESIVSPGLSVTLLRRNLPRVDITATTNDDTLSVNELDLRTTAWRLVAGKSLIAFSVAVGVGQDRYTSAADFSLAVHEAGNTYSATPTSPRQRLTRTNYFADVSWNFLLVRAVAELGAVSGGDVATFNRFRGTGAAGTRPYGSVGLRLGL
jgi:hypothetical protein